MSNLGRVITLLSFGLLTSACDDSRTPPAADRGEQVDQLVDAYLLQSFFAARDGHVVTHDHDHPPLCEEPVEPDDPIACADAACALLDSYECDDPSEVLPLLKACKGNFGGACLNGICSHLDSYECDDASEVVPLIHACRDTHDSSCVDTLCGYLDSYECDDASEVLPLLSACAGSLDHACIAFVCSQLDSYECDDPSELLAIASSCSE